MKLWWLVLVLNSYSFALSEQREHSNLRSGNLNLFTNRFLQDDTCDSCLVSPIFPRVIYNVTYLSCPKQYLQRNLHWPSVSDPCGSKVTLVPASTPVEGCDDILVVWTAINDCFQMSTATQHVIFSDQKPPKLVGAVPDDVTVQCNQLPNATPLVYRDYCFGEFTVLPTDGTPMGNVCDGLKLERTYVGPTDPCNNQAASYIQTITMLDQSPPVFPELPDIQLTCPQQIYSLTLEPPNVTDDCTSNEDIRIVSGTTPPDGCSDAFVIWSALDSCHKIASATQRIVFGDSDAPSVKRKDLPEDIQVSCDAIPERTKLTFRDNCWESFEVWSIDSVLSGAKCSGRVVERTWPGPQDSCGNLADNITQTIEVEPMGPTVMDLVSAASVLCPDDAYDLAAPSARDGCNDPLEVTGVFTQETSCEEGIMTWTTELDACGDTAAMAQEVSITGSMPSIACPVMSAGDTGVSSNQTFRHVMDYGDCYGSAQDNVSFSVIPTCINCGTGRLCSGDFEYEVDQSGSLTILKVPDNSMVEWIATIDYGCGSQSVSCSVGDC